MGHWSPLDSGVVGGEVIQTTYQDFGLTNGTLYPSTCVGCISDRGKRLQSVGLKIFIQIPCQVKLRSITYSGILPNWLRLQMLILIRHLQKYLNKIHIPIQSPFFSAAHTALLIDTSTTINPIRSDPIADGYYLALQVQLHTE